MKSGKRTFPVILILSVVILSLLLSSCNSNQPQSEPYSATVETNGQSITIIFDESSFSSGKIEAKNGEYEFQYETQLNGLKFTVTYPDGCIYSQTTISGGISYPHDYDSSEREAKGYIDLLSLDWAIDSAVDNAQGKGSQNGPSPLLAVLLLGCGVWHLFAPKTAWWLARGWWYKNAEPSDLALMLYRILGIILLFVGIICLIASV